MLMLKRSLLPIVNYNTRTLIFGSLPSDISIKEQQYYAHPQNKFWQLMSSVLDINLTNLTYKTRLDVLLENHIGIWDVILEGKRQGSLDCKICSYISQDFLAFFKTLPKLTTIAFNGKLAQSIGVKTLQHQGLYSHYTILPLPSSSSAYTIPYLAKLSKWFLIRKLNG